MPNRPDAPHYTTHSGDPMPMLSAYPDNEVAIDVPENVIAWLLGV